MCPYIFPRSHGRRHRARCSQIFSTNRTAFFSFRLMDPGADPLAPLLLIAASVASKHFKQSSSTSTARYLLAATCMIAVQVYQARMVLSLPVWMGHNIGRPLRNLQFQRAQIQPIPVRLPLCAFMHRVWSMSGEQLAAVSVDKVRSGVHSKGSLRILHGFPLCMQRLLYNGKLLHNWTELTAPIDVQLILQPLSTDLQQHTAAQELVTFACKHGQVADGTDVGGGWCSQVWPCRQRCSLMRS